MGSQSRQIFIIMELHPSLTSHPHMHNSPFYAFSYIYASSEKYSYLDLLLGISVKAFTWVQSCPSCIIWGQLPSCLDSCPRVEVPGSNGFRLEPCKTLQVPFLLKEVLPLFSIAVLTLVTSACLRLADYAEQEQLKMEPCSTKTSCLIENGLFSQ